LERREDGRGVRDEERRGYEQEAWSELKRGEYWGEQRRNEERNEEALRKSSRQEPEKIGGRV